MDTGVDGVEGCRTGVEALDTRAHIILVQMQRHLQPRGPHATVLPVTPLRRSCGAWDTEKPGIDPRAGSTIYEYYNDFKQ